MPYTKEELAKFAAQAVELRQRAHQLEIEQSKLNKYSAAEQQRHWSLGVRVELLRREAISLETIAADSKRDP